jgi:hypothetical protein
MVQFLLVRMISVTPGIARHCVQAPERHVSCKLEAHSLACLEESESCSW